MFYDPQKDLRKHEKNLPHWRQENVIYFVTSRLGDSMPQEKLSQWQKARQAWLNGHGLSASDKLTKLPEEQQHEFHQQFTKLWHQWLDAGYGACWLGDPPIRKLVIDQFFKHDGDGSRLDAWVVMPNHFHALVQVREVGGLGRLVQHWKGGSAREINQVIGRAGSLWQQEPHDHIVRSEAQLQHYRRYVAKNPIDARLKTGEYSVGMGTVEWDSAQAFLDSLTQH